MSVRVNKSGWLLMQGLKFIFKFGLFALGAILAVASDERPKPRYTSDKAEELYENGVISDTEYAQCIYGDK